MSFLFNQDKKYKMAIKKPVDFWDDLLNYVKAGVEKSLDQLNDGQTKSFGEVKTLIDNR